MDARIIKEDNSEFISHFPITVPSMGWYFAPDIPEGAIQLKAGIWTCMFKHIDDVAKGKKICFSADSAGCSGAACYFGFTQPNKKAGGFLASKEKFKENIGYGNEFYHQIKAIEPREKFLILSNLDQIGFQHVNILKGSIY